MSRPPATEKRAGPGFKKRAVPLAGCRDCRGRGLVRGVFYEMPCDGCAGSGIVHKETGEALPTDELVLQLRLRLNHAGKQIRHLEQQLADHRRTEGWGPNGMRYHGD